ncbi:MAG: MgtC/SapB family protein [Verrucomicrobiaceae bacterium]|nr:MAG: MgtC/SapB family protein [Verrucomicrobiaceae bacterium]
MTGWDMVAALRSGPGDITPDILLRLGLSAVAGGLLGIEREHHGRAAGLRTTLLVCLAACVAMILSDGFYRHSFHGSYTGGGWHPDPARLAAGVLSGMGFLGAGVIIHQSNHMVRGVTTAATLWFVTIIGLAFGSGAIGIGLIATAGSLAVLILVPSLEHLIKNDWYSDLTVSFVSAECTVDGILAALAPVGVRVKTVDMEEDLATGVSQVTLHLRYKRQGSPAFSDTIASSVRTLPGVLRIALKS